MHKEVHLLKMLILFAAVTSGAVFIAIEMHGRGNSLPLDATANVQLASLLPVPASSMRPFVTKPRPVAPVSKQYEVRAAIPIAMAEPVPASPGSPPPPSAPVQLASLSVTRSDIQDIFSTRLPNVPGDAGLTAAPLPPVYQAVLAQNEEWLLELLKSGLSPDDVTAAGDTALCAAVQGGYDKGVEILLLHGADTTKAGREGQPPLALAVLKRNQPILEALLHGGADPNTVFRPPVQNEILDLVKQPELKMSLRSDTGVTALMAAAARGDVEATVALLKHGAKSSSHTKRYSRYPINFAADQRYLFVMRILLGRSPESEPDMLVTIDLSQQKAWIAEQGVIVDSTKVSTGREGYRTPTGRYVVTDKHRSWTSTLYHVSMPYFMRLNCSAIGLHSGYVSGRPASHGCIRLPYDKAKKWFSVVKVGDEVEIVQ